MHLPPCAVKYTYSEATITAIRVGNTFSLLREQRQRRGMPVFLLLRVSKKNGTIIRDNAGQKRIEASSERGGTNFINAGALKRNPRKIGGNPLRSVSCRRGLEEHKLCCREMPLHFSPLPISLSAAIQERVQSSQSPGYSCPT